MTYRKEDMKEGTKGKPVPPDDLDRFEELKALFKPAEAIKRLEDYAKWLFSGTVVVASLGAGLSNAAFSQLAGYGKIMFAVAVIVVGLSLAFASLSLAPQWAEYNPNSADSMEKAVAGQFRQRRRLLKYAAAFFAAGLAIAALAPFMSGVSYRHDKDDEHVIVKFNLDAEGKLDAEISTAGLKPYTGLELDLDAKPTPASGPGKVVMPRILGSADVNGVATLKATLNDVARFAEISIIAKWTDATGNKHVESRVIPVAYSQIPAVQASR